MCLSFIDSGVGRSLCPGCNVLFLKSLAVFWVSLFRSMPFTTGKLFKQGDGYFSAESTQGSKVACP